jgi:AcrR family transcriptional regulator
VTTPSKVRSVNSVKTSRSDKAAATRQRMLDAAYALFCEQGFRATTMAAIAERADVAVQTVYFTFHTKDALLQEVHNQTVLGRDPLPPPEQPWFRAAVAEPDPRQAVANVVQGVGTILARVAPMLPVFHTVAGDAAGEIYRRGERLRWEGMRELTLDVLLPKQPVRRGLSPDQAVGLVFVLLGPESYRAFVLAAGWSPEQWTAWTINTLVDDLYGRADP